MDRAKHQELTEKRGKIIANRVMRDFRASYNLALRIADDPDALPDNPVKAVTFNKERRKWLPLTLFNLAPPRRALSP